MKKVKTTLRFAFAAALLLGSAASAEARSWRINSDASKKPHFTDINAAMASDDVVAGDTLYLDPGTRISAVQNVTKQVTVVGTGYYLDSSVMEEAILSNHVYLKAAGVRLEGVRITTGSSPYAEIHIQAEGVSIERCRVEYVSVEATDVLIRQCIGYRVYGQGISSTASARCTIENSILATMGSQPLANLYEAVIRNNYVWTASTSNYPLTSIGQSTIVNNLFVGKSDPNRIFNNVNGTITNNVMSCTAATYPSCPDNTYLGALPSAAYFSDAPIFDDDTDDKANVALKDFDPLIGAATDGGDCGPFGGMYPYVCSGFPLGMPYFGSSTVPTRPQDGQLRVTQKVVLQAE